MGILHTTEPYILHKHTKHTKHITMGLLSKAAIVGAGYYAYKHHQNKKRAERGEIDPSQQKRDAPNDYYHDNKSQLEYPQQQNGNPSYASFDRKSEYASGAKYWASERRTLEWRSFGILAFGPIQLCDIPQ